MQRITSGIKNLDKLLDGGFPDRVSVLVSGDPGAGKTLFSLNFLMEGISKNEKCVYLTLNENKEEILRACDGITPLKKARKNLGKKFIIEHLTLEEITDLDYFIKIIKAYPQIDRIVIDNVNKLLSFSDNKSHYRKNLDQLLRLLKKKCKCSILLCETLDGTLDTGNGEAYDVDGVLHFEFVDISERPLRLIGIYKMRYTKIEPRVLHELLISSKEINLKATKVL